MDNISNWQAGLGLFVPAQKLPVTDRAAVTKAKEQAKKQLGRFDDAPIDGSGLTSVEIARTKGGAPRLHVELPRTSSSQERQVSQPISIPRSTSNVPAGTRSRSTSRREPRNESVGDRLPVTPSVSSNDSRRSAVSREAKLPPTSSTRGAPVPVSIQQPPVQTRNKSAEHVEAGKRSADAGKKRAQHPERLRPVPSTAPAHSSGREKAGSRSGRATQPRRDVPPNTPSIGPSAEDERSVYRSKRGAGLRSTDSANQSPVREGAGSRRVR